MAPAKKRKASETPKPVAKAGITSFFSPASATRTAISTSNSTDPSGSLKRKRSPPQLIEIHDTDSGDDDDIVILDPVPSTSTLTKPSKPVASSTKSKKPRIPPTAANSKAGTAKSKQVPSSAKGKAKANGKKQQGDDDAVRLDRAVTRPLSVALEEQDKNWEGETWSDGEIPPEAMESEPLEFPKEPEMLDDEEGGDDWAEEAVRINEPEEEADLVIQGSSKDLDRARESGPTCPVCSRDLSAIEEKERNLHVGRCLDDKPSPSKATFGSSIFRPLSALFRPTALSSSTATPVSSKTPLSTTSAAKSAKGKASTAPTPPKVSQPLSSLPLPVVPKPKSSMPNAFTALMSGTSEDKQWKEAEASDKHRGRMPKGEKRAVPFYKWIEGMEVTVDAFRYGRIEGCKGYFLSHAHSDHYQNLAANWEWGPIYCSVTTANLIKLKLGVKDEWVHALPMDQTVVVQGINVTLIDANHCPGSVLFMFEGPHTDPSSPFTKNPKLIKRYLHCGDFRASPVHINHPAIAGKRIDIVYLDTTYLDHKYCFPPQELVIEACADLVKARCEGGDENNPGAQFGMLKGWLGVKKEIKDEEGSSSSSVKGEEGDGTEMEGEEMDDDPGVNKDEVLESQDVEEAMRIETEEDEALRRASEEVDDIKPVLALESGTGWPEPSISVEGDEEKSSLAIATIKAEKELCSPFAVKGEDEDEEKKPSLGIKGEDEDVKPKKHQRMLVVVGTYSIGKERIVKGIARTLNSKVYCEEKKLAILHAQDDPELHAMITRDPYEAQVHIVYLQQIKRDDLADYLDKFGKGPNRFTKVMGLRPTGWTYRPEGGQSDAPTVAKVVERELNRRKFTAANLYPQRDCTSTHLSFGVPYSEHSSFFELSCFALSLNYIRIIPTVNVHSENSRKKMSGWVEKWRMEKKRRADARLPRMVPPRNVNYW